MGFLDLSICIPDPSSPLPQFFFWPSNPIDYVFTLCTCFALHEPCMCPASISSTQSPTDNLIVLPAAAQTPPPPPKIYIKQKASSGEVPRQRFTKLVVCWRKKQSARPSIFDPSLRDPDPPSPIIFFRPNPFVYIVPYIDKRRNPLSIQLSLTAQWAEPNKSDCLRPYSCLSARLPIPP